MECFAELHCIAIVSNCLVCQCGSSIHCYFCHDGSVLSAQICQIWKSGAGFAKNGQTPGPNSSTTLFGSHTVWLITELEMCFSHQNKTHLTYRQTDHQAELAMITSQFTQNQTTLLNTMYWLLFWPKLLQSLRVIDRLQVTLTTGTESEWQTQSREHKPCHSFDNDVDVWQMWKLHDTTYRPMIGHPATTPALLTR